MHSWGDEWAYWDDMNRVVDFMWDYLHKWRFPARDVKEKWGTLRVYCSFGWTSPHDITHPGHAYIRYKKGGIMWSLQYSKVVRWIFQYILHKPSQLFHIWVYRRAYRLACEKWPQCAAEILTAADYPELLVNLRMKYEAVIDAVRKENQELLDSLPPD
jgi:hypothetical protein